MAVGHAESSLTRPNTSKKHSRRRHRRRNSPSSPHHSDRNPTTYVLSILTTLGLSLPPASATPLTPIQEPHLPFLYPSIDLESLPSGSGNVLHPHRELQSASRKLATKRNIFPRPIPDNFPAKWEEGDDGRWRKAKTYSLYGSAACPDCSSTPHPVIDDKVVEGDFEPFPDINPQVQDFVEDLPNGWQPANTRSKAKTTLILSLSLVLALIICAFMIIFVVWRRQKSQQRRKDQDMEMRARSPAPTIEEEEAERERRLRQRIWARATARWKADAHARQRKRRRPTGSRVSISETSLRQQVSSSSLRDATHTASLSSSRTSLRSQTSSRSTTPPPHSATDVSTDNGEQQPRPTFPPAYGHQREVSLDSPNDVHSQHSSLPQPPSPNTAYTSSAHVATDDKLTLARMAQLVSSPPDASHPDMPDLGPPSAPPIWEDDQASEVAHVPEEPPSSSKAKFDPGPFPEPPQMAHHATPSFYQYNSSSDEIENLGSTPEPSAPPFDSYPSAPPLDDLDLEASAPLEDDIDSVDAIPDQEQDQNNDGEEELETGESSEREERTPVCTQPPEYHP